MAKGSRVVCVLDSGVVTLCLLIVRVYLKVVAGHLHRQPVISRHHPLNFFSVT
jgi:hypothetical protein